MKKYIFEKKTVTFVASSESMGDGAQASTMDYFQDVQYPHLSLAVPYLEGLNYKVEVIDWQNPQVKWKEKSKIILGPVWGYTRNIDKFIAWLEVMESDNLKMINSPKFLKWNVDKNYLNDMRENGIQIPQTLIVNSNSDLSFDDAVARFKNMYNSVDFILKGVIDAGGFGYMHVQPDNWEQARLHFEHLKKNNHGVIIQNFLPEISNKGELAFVFFNDEISHFFLKVPPYNEEKVQPFYGGKSFHFKKSKIKEQIDLIRSDFRNDLSLTVEEVQSGYEQVKGIYSQILQMLDRLGIPHPKYLRVDGVMVDSRFVIMELEGIEPYLEMQEGMNNDPSNPILEKYVQGVVGVAR